MSRKIGETLMNKKKATNNFLANLGCALIVIIFIAVIAMPFRIYSSLYAISSMSSAKAINDLAAPNNQPQLEPSSQVVLERIAPPKNSFDIGYAITGELKGWNVITLLEGSSAVIAFQEEPIKLRFNFAQLETPGGHWRSEEVRVILSGAIDQTLKGKPEKVEKKWGSGLGISSTMKDVEPNFSVVVPLNQIDINSAISDRKIDIKVEMDIEYPLISSTAAYDDYEGTLEHAFSLTVLTPAEFEEYRSITNAYFLQQSIRIILTWVGLVLIPAGLFVFYLRKRNEDKKKTSKSE
jgi:hypothetical protein